MRSIPIAAANAPAEEHRLERDVQRARPFGHPFARRAEREEHGEGEGVDVRRLRGQDVGERREESRSCPVPPDCSAPGDVAGGTAAPVGSSSASTSSPWTTSVIRRSTPVEARKPDPVRSAAKTNATTIAADTRWRATSATSSPVHPIVGREPGHEGVVAEVPAGEHHAAGETGEAAGDESAAPP